MSEGVRGYVDRIKCERLPFVSYQQRRLFRINNKKTQHSTPTTSWDGKTAVPPILRENIPSLSSLLERVPRLVVRSSESGNPYSRNDFHRPSSLFTVCIGIFFLQRFGYIIYYPREIFKSLFGIFLFFSCHRIFCVLK